MQRKLYSRKKKGVRMDSTLGPNPENRDEDR